MSTLTALTLVAAKKPTMMSPMVVRRNKLCAKLWEQIELAKGEAAGQPFVMLKSRSIRDADTGLRRSVDVPKRLRPWWWVSESGRVCVSVRYGSKVLELSKGKAAVEVATPHDLVSTLEAIKGAVLAGELDAQIEAASGALRSGFKR